MNFLRYRRPSFNTILGIAKALMRVKKELGITVAPLVEEQEGADEARNRLSIGGDTEAVGKVGRV